MDAITIQIVSVVAILGFLWKLHHEVSNLHKDNADLRKDVGKDIADVRKGMADLRERMARVEGLLEGFVGRSPEPQS